MIKILILDDSDRKIDYVKKVLIEGCGLHEEHIVVAKSVSGGREAVSKDYFDLVLLDLVLPNFDNEDPQDDGGLSFIRSIIATDSRIKMPTQIIGLTEKDYAYEKEKDEFQSLLFSVIQCKQGQSDWIDKLRQAVNYAIRCKQAIETRLKSRTQYDIAVICAISEEFKQMLSAFGGEDKWADVILEEDIPFIFKQTSVTTAKGNVIKVIAAMAGRPGVIPTSVLTTLMYVLFHVDTVFMTGFSAGFPSNKLRLGDILVASSIQDYASGKLQDIEGSMSLLKEIHQIEAATRLTLEMQELIEDEDTQSSIMSKIRKVNLLIDQRDSYQISMSSTCCGPYVVTSEKLVNELKDSDRKLEGLDMEGFGLYLTSKLLSNNKQKGALWMKGVGDFANPQKADGYHKTCSFGSACLLYRFIKEKM